MMKKRFYLISLVIFIALGSFSQDSKHTISISTGYGIEFDNSIYIDFEEPDYTIWATPMTNISFNLTYEYSVSDYLRIGPRFEYEKINFESFYTDKTYANRFAVGAQFITVYPKSSLHAEAGGFFNIGKISCEEFDNPVGGIEYGLIAGPAYQLENFTVAILFQPCFGYYFISDGESPESGLIMYPRILGKICYSF